MVRLPSPPPRRSERQKQTERSFGGFDWTEAMLLCAMGGLALWDFDKAYDKHQRKSEQREARRQRRERGSEPGSCDDGNRGVGRGSRSGSRRGRRTRSVGAGGSSRRDDARGRSERPDRYRDEDGARRRRRRERGDNARYRGSGGGHYGFDARDDRRSDGGRRASDRAGPSRVESWVYGDSVGDAGSARGEGPRRSSRRDDRRGSW